MPTRVIRSDVNLGPAGGWAIALRDFLSSDFSDAWVMDDDIVPEAECLATLLMARDEDPGRTFVVPVSIQPDGAVGRWGSWCGFMIAREIVEAVGLPRAELFWWAEDTEYCHWRIPQAGFERRVIEEAVVHHDAIRQRRRAAMEVLLRSSEHALLPPLHHAQGGSLPAECLQASWPGDLSTTESSP